MKTPIKLGGVLYTKDEEGEVWVEYDRVKNIVAQAQQETLEKVREWAKKNLYFKARNDVLHFLQELDKGETENK